MYTWIFFLLFSILIKKCYPIFTLVFVFKMLWLFSHAHLLEYIRCTAIVMFISQFVWLSKPGDFGAPRRWKTDYLRWSSSGIWLFRWKLFPAGLFGRGFDKIVNSLLMPNIAMRPIQSKLYVSLYNFNSHCIFLHVL